jgi:hypothetical protein
VRAGRYAAATVFQTSSSGMGKTPPDVCGSSGRRTMEFAAVTTRLEHDRRLSALKIRRSLELAFRAVPHTSSLQHASSLHI